MNERRSAARDASITIRPARPSDVDAAAAVYVAADRASAMAARERLRDAAAASRDTDAHEAAEDLRALIGNGTAGKDIVLLAFGDGPTPVGVAAAVVRQRHAHISYLFVHPEQQGRGIGRALLERLRCQIADAGCDVTSLHASRDPRAVQCYLRYGLQPAPPLISLSARNPSFPELNLRDGLESHPLSAGDPAQLATVGDIDAVVRGVRRPNDLVRWLAAGAHGALLTRRGTAVPAGYYLIAAAEPRARIGPVAAIDVERVPDVVSRALAAAAALPNASGVEWRIDVPAENRAAIPPLLDAGFRVRQLTPYLTTGPIGRWDRYVFHDEDVL